MSKLTIAHNLLVCVLALTVATACDLLPTSETVSLEDSPPYDVSALWEMVLQGKTVTVPAQSPPHMKALPGGGWTTVGSKPLPIPVRVGTQRPGQADNPCGGEVEFGRKETSLSIRAEWRPGLDEYVVYVESEGEHYTKEFARHTITNHVWLFEITSAGSRQVSPTPPETDVDNTCEHRMIDVDNGIVHYTGSQLPGAIFCAGSSTHHEARTNDDDEEIWTEKGYDPGWGSLDPEYCVGVGINPGQPPVIVPY